MAGTTTSVSMEVDKENIDDGIQLSTQTESDKTEKLIKLPLSRIKYLIKMDPDVNLASHDAVVMIAKATELFLQVLSKESYSHTLNSKRKTVQRRDFDLAMEHIDALAFLEGALDS